MDNVDPKLRTLIQSLIYGVVPELRPAMADHWLDTLDKAGWAVVAKSVAAKGQWVVDTEADVGSSCTGLMFDDEDPFDRDM